MSVQLYRSILWYLLTSIEWCRSANIKTKLNNKQVVAYVYEGPNVARAQLQRSPLGGA